MHSSARSFGARAAFNSPRPCIVVASVGGAVATLVVAVIGRVIAASFAFEARMRARELEQVVEFESAQLSGLDPQRTGEHLRQAFLDESAGVRGPPSRVARWFPAGTWGDYR